jgi:hypothetical protein
LAVQDVRSKIRSSVTEMFTAEHSVMVEPYEFLQDWNPETNGIQVAILQDQSMVLEIGGIITS